MINKQLQELEFASTELSLVAALVLWGFRIEAIDRTELSRVVFHLKRSSDLDSAVQAFWANTARVSPKDYFQVLRELKSRIREGL